MLRLVNAASKHLFLLHHCLVLATLSVSIILSTVGLPPHAQLVPPACAQTNSQDWSDPVTIFHTAGFISSPRIVSSCDGHIHLFWIENQNPDPSRRSGYPEAIFHTASKDGIHWLEPRDIFTAPSGGRINGLSVTVDRHDRAHLVFADWEGGVLYYASASLQDAHNLASWSQSHPLVLTRVWRYQIQVAEERLLLMYTLLDEPYGLFLIASPDGGASWSRPVRIPTGSDENMPQDIAFAVAPDGAIHTVWATYSLPDGYPPVGIYYSRSTDNGATWVAASQIADGPYGLPDIIVAPAGWVYITWSGAASVGGRYFRFSGDGGTSWSDLITIAPGVGGLTGSSMALDNGGVLHYVTASHIEINGVGYSQWEGSAWSPLINISKTYIPALRDEDRRAFEPVITITGGNQLHVAYLGQSHSDVLYVTAKSTAPGAMVDTCITTPTPTATPREFSPTPPALSGPDSPTRAISPLRPIERPKEGVGSGLVILTGVLSAAVFVAALTTVYLMRKRP